MKTLSDEEFLFLWAQHQSVAAISKVTGVSQRQLYARRRSLESKYNTDLPNAKEVKLYQEAYKTVIQVEIKNGKIMIGSDAHYHPSLPPSTAHRAFVRLAREINPEIVILNGDLFDFPSISRHHRIGLEKQPTVAEEIDVVKDRLHEIFDATKNSKHIRTIGNHDLRYDGFISNRAREMEGVKGNKLEDHFPGWLETWTVQVNEPCELLIMHRWKSSLHAPLLHVKEAGCSVVTGHKHQQSEYDHSYINNREVYGIDAGTMAELHDGANPCFVYTEGRPLNWRAGWIELTFMNGKLMPPERCRVIENGKVWFHNRCWDV